MRPTFLNAPPIFDSFLLICIGIALGAFFSSGVGVGVGVGEGVGDADGEGVATALAPVAGVVFGERRAK